MKPFITFEGIDGSGKDTNLIELVKEIKEDGNNFLGGNKYSTVWITREPTKLTDSGKYIAKLIREREVSAQEASKGFVNDRIEHSNKFIKPFLEHSYVLSSRYDLSTLTYQMTQGISFEELYDLHNYNSQTGALIPDLTIVFDISVEEAFRRMSKRVSVKEVFEEKEFQEKVKKNIDIVIPKLREYDGRSIIRINAEQIPAQVKKEMIEKVQDWYNLNLQQ